MKASIFGLLCCTIVSVVALVPLTAAAQTPIVRPDLHTDTKVAPLYFGPNAFPVPDMLDEAVVPTLRATLGADYACGDYGDRATSAMLRLRLPLFTTRANLAVWVPIVEGYRLTPEWKEHARIADNPTMRGCEVGSAFVSTDVVVLTEARRRPLVTVRAAMKTASEDDWTTARYYDCPGYFFDAALGKGLRFRGSALRELRMAASGGFLCWQTDNGRQNDATMYAVGLKARFGAPAASDADREARRGIECELSQDLRGYSGWEGDGDRPMVVKTRLAVHIPLGKTSLLTSKSAPRSTLNPFVSYEKGLRDYPFRRLEVGLSVDFDILRKQREL